MQLDIGRNPKGLLPDASKEYLLPAPSTNARIVAQICSAQQPPMELCTARYFVAMLATILSRQKCFFEELGNSSLGLRNAYEKPASGALATSNINPLPSKQPRVDRPCTWSEHCHAESESREEEVNDRYVPCREDKAKLDDCLQNSRYRRPQSCQQQTSNADLNES